MSAYTMDQAFAPIQAHYKSQVMVATWGHLAAKRNKTYAGYIVFATGSYGDDDLNPTVLAAEFRGLDDSPWLFEAMTDFEQNNCGEPGNVYRFAGTLKNYEFKGTITKVYTATQSTNQKEAA